MRNYVIINGVNSLTIQGLAINNLPPITKPMIRTQREEIDGRDGDIVTELGYSAYDKQMEIGLYGNFDIDAIIKYFTGEGTIVFSNEADKYYNFKILDQIDYEKLLKFKTAVVTFHCQPFKYPLEEEPEEAEITTITGTGENITLEDTEEAPMKIVYKGNTYQYSTSGKNLLNLPDETQTSNGITFVVQNGEITINGTATGTTFYQGTINLPVTAEKYSWSANNPVANTNVLMRFFGNATNFMQGYFTIANKTQTETFESAVTLEYLVIRIASGTTLTNFKIKPQLEKGDPTSYEPYTNGASPNPDYPQDIEVVTGSNTIKVEGKNLFNASIQTGTYIGTGHTTVYTVANDGKITQSETDSSSFTASQNRCFTLPAGTYAYKITGKSNATNIQIRNVTDNADLIRSTNNTGTFTISGEKIVALKTFSSSDTYPQSYYVQIEKGSQATTYEPYTGASYPINLPVENLLDISDITNGGGITNNDNRSITLNGNITSTSYTLTTPFVLKANETYTLSVSNLYPEGGYCTFILRNGSTNVMAVRYSEGYITYTPTQDTTINTLRIFNTGVSFNNYTFSVQLEKGTKANHYTPYGTTPIWLGWIRNTDYGDKIDKSTGKNLFNGVMELGIYDGDTGQPVSNNSYMRCKDYIPVDEQTKYVITSVDLSVELAVYEYKGDYSYNLTTNRVLQNGQSFTTNSGTKYIKFRPRVANTDLTSKFMVNKGSTALPYEPYGTSWYLKKEIGKVVLNGSESGWANDGGGAPYKYVISDIKNPPSNSYTEVFCNNYYPVPYSENWNNYDYFITRPPYASTVQGVKFKNKDISSLNDFKTWLGTHNTEVYYVLETPTYTLIEGELLNQLEAIKMSYEGQTNLSQTNNDLAFELDASVTFLSPMEINNIGNIYAKPILTIEGTGNIGVVLNGIQILEIDLTNNGKITIDVPKLEAYNPDDDSLLNRLVTGDYMKLLINEGENKITFTGEVSGATLTNYIRWI